MSNVLKEGSRNFCTENWKVLHPNGKHMFTCNGKRAKWYLKNDHAVKVNNKTIKLTFTPQGQGFDENDIFGLSDREFKCVVSGKEHGLQRHHVVPYCYRKYFPEEYKSRNHHDVVYLTHTEHSKYESEATKFKNQLADEYGVGKLNEYNQKFSYIINQYNYTRIKAIAKLHSIFRSYNKIPKSIVKENLIFVAEELEVEPEFLFNLNYLQLYKIYLELKSRHKKEFEKFKKEKAIKFDHAYHLVQKLKTHEDYKNFIIRWRKHFIQTAKPKYMPKGWDINYRVKVELN